MKKPGTGQRIARQLRLTRSALTPVDGGTPPFLVLFINSICNLACDHCFYWRDLNQRDDLTFEELVRLSEDLGPLENLNLSGGEPFIRKDFADDRAHLHPQQRCQTNLHADKRLLHRSNRTGAARAS